MADHRKKVVYNNNNNAICYYRYSSSSQREESIEEQQAAAHRYAEAHNLNIIAEYKDPAKSGTDITRPDFNRMLYEMKILKPGHLIVWKVDRIARDTYIQAITKHELDEAGVRIDYIAEVMPEDASQRKLWEGLQAIFSEQYIDGLKQNIIRGQNHNAEHCLYNGHRPFGYTGKVSQPYEIDPITSVYAKKIFQEYADGVSAVTIADELNNAGITTTRGCKFRPQTINHILENECYIGVYHYRDYRIEDGMPRLIDDELWNKVQDRVKKNRRGGRKPAVDYELDRDGDYWLTGHIYCGYCNESMHEISGDSHTGRRYNYYICNGRKKKKCKKKNVRADFLEKIVSDVMNEFISRPEIRITIAHQCWLHFQEQNTGSDAYQKSLKADLKDTDNRLNNLLNALETGTSAPSIVKRIEALEGQKKMLSEALEAERSKRKLQMSERDILKFLNTFTDAQIKDPVSRDRLLTTLIDKVYVYDDKVVVTMFFTDDHREVSFDDYKEAIAKDPLMIINEADYSNLPDITDDQLAALKGEKTDPFDSGVKLSPLLRKGSTTISSSPLGMIVADLLIRNSEKTFIRGISGIFHTGV